MPIIDWLQNLARARAQDFIVAPLGVANGAPVPAAVAVDADYVTLRIKAARIVDIRKWASKFYGCVNSRVRFLHEAGGLIEHHTVLAPDELKDVDPAHLDRIIAIDKVLFGPVPYRGRLDLTVALFSVKSTDLAAPYIDLLTALADTAGLAFLAAAKPYIEPLRKGADLLFGTANASQLEIGFDRDFAALDAGYYIAIRAPKTAVALTQLRLDANDFRLTDASGQPFGDYPYFVLAIERSAQRPDWMLIPDLKAAWDEARQAFVTASGDVDGVLDRFERLCLASPDLVPTDAQRLIHKARAMFTQPQAHTFGVGPTKGPAPMALPDFEHLKLYG